MASDQAPPRPAIHGWVHRWRTALHRTSHTTARLAGSGNAPLVALLLVAGGAAAGFFLDYSQGWQRVVDLCTTVVTFVLVFFLQTAQRRDTHAIQLKLDELISSNKGARNRLVALETMNQRELDELQLEFERLREQHRSSPSA